MSSTRYSSTKLLLVKIMLHNNFSTEKRIYIFWSFTACQFATCIISDKKLDYGAVGVQADLTGCLERQLGYLLRNIQDLLLQ